MKETLFWLNTWFMERSAATETVLEDSKDFIKEGWIDSFEFLELISEIEEAFQIEFTDDDFQNESILTIYGLAMIITGRIKKSEKT